MTKTYFWLKLQNNFFDKEEIKLIETMPNGYKYINFYLKLLLKSIETEGTLLFRNIIPYTPEMLSSITNTDIDTVKVASDLFIKLGLMDKLKDGSLFMNEVNKMIGKETSEAVRKRQYRAKLEHKSGTLSLSCPTEIEIEKELEKDIDKEINKDNDGKPSTTKSNKFIKPTLQEIKDYCLERKNNVNAEKFINYYESNGWKVGKNSMKSWKACIRTWEINNTETKPTAIINSLARI